MPSTKVRAIISDIGRVIVGVDVSRAVQEPLHRHLAFAQRNLVRDRKRSALARSCRKAASPRATGISTSFAAWAPISPMINSFKPGTWRFSPRLYSPTRSGPGWRKAIASLSSPTPTRSTSPTWNPLSPSSNTSWSASTPASLAPANPSPLVYLEALRALKVQSNEAVYIDDLQENVDAAKALGMSGVHCTAPEKLAGCLRELGIDIP